MCVTPNIRDQAKADDAAAASRRNSVSLTLMQSNGKHLVKVTNINSGRATAITETATPKCPNSTAARKRTHRQCRRSRAASTDVTTPGSDDRVAGGVRSRRCCCGRVRDSAAIVGRYSPDRDDRGSAVHERIVPQPCAAGARARGRCALSAWVGPSATTREEAQMKLAAEVPVPDPRPPEPPPVPQPDPAPIPDPIPPQTAREAR